MQTRCKKEQKNSRNSAGNRKRERKEGSVSGPSNAFASSVVAPVTLEMFQQFIESHFTVEPMEDGSLNLISAPMSTKREKMKSACSSFEDELLRRKEDLKVTKAAISRIQEKLIDAEEADEVDTVTQAELNRQILIAREHKKQIRRIESNERMKSVKFCTQRVRYVIQKFTDETDKKCENMHYAKLRESRRADWRNNLKVGASRSLSLLNCFFTLLLPHSLSLTARSLFSE